MRHPTRYEPATSELVMIGYSLSQHVAFIFGVVSSASGQSHLVDRSSGAGLCRYPGPDVQTQGRRAPLKRNETVENCSTCEKRELADWHSIPTSLCDYRTVESDDDLIPRSARTQRHGEPAWVASDLPM